MKVKVKRKIVAIIMLILVIFNSLPINSFAAFITDINSNAEFGVVSGSLAEYNHELHYANYDGATYLLFCTQFGNTSPTGREYEYGNEFLAYFKENRAEYQNMAEMIYFGYAMNYGMGLPSSYDAKVAAACTQQYVWEMLNNAPGRDSWNPNYMSSGIYQNWLNQTQGYYNQYHTNVSFTGAKYDVSIGDTTTINDSNGVLCHYPAFSHEKNGITFSHDNGSNDLKVNASNNASNDKVTFNTRDYGIYELMPNGDTYNSGTMSNYISFEFTSGNVQNMMFSNYIDPFTFSVSVEVKSGNLQVKKINSNGNPVANCSFDLYSNESCTNKIGNSTSNEDGLLLFENLRPGTYWVRETSVPNGYLLDTNIKSINVVSGQTVTIEFENNEPKGSIEIIKKDSETGSVPQGDAEFTDAIYEVYAEEDIYNVAKTYKFYSKGDLVATRNMNEKGTTEVIEQLPLGKYLVKEKSASKGYMLDTNEYHVHLKYKDQVSPLISDTVISNEDVQKMGVHIFKSGIKKYSGKTPGLEGAEFTIKLNKNVQEAYSKGYTYEEVWGGIDENGNKVNVDENRVKEAQVIAPSYARITTDSEGNAYTQKNLPYGKYICKETYTPQDFETAVDFTFSITQDESQVKEVAQKVKVLVVNDDQMESYVRLVKKDAKTGKTVTLNNTTFQIKATKDILDRGTGKVIYKKGDIITQKIGNTTYDTFTTNAQNFVVADKSYSSKFDILGSITLPLTLPVGSYEIFELKIPDGFLQLDESIKFKIEKIRDYDKDPDGDPIVEINIKNDKPTGTLLVDKKVAVRENIDTSLIDISDLSGIKFKLTAKEDIIDMADGSKIYTKGQEVGIYNLTKEGSLKVDNIPMGKYELKEIATIDGLVLNDKSYDIVFTQKDLVTKVYDKKIEVTNDTTLFDFSKTDVTGDIELEGAKLTITDSDGNIVDEWTSTKEKHTIEGLVVGKEYTMTEEIAPDGFVKATTISFKVENTKEIQHVQMKDKIVEISKQDIAGEEIEGAKLQVLDKDNNVIDEWESGKEAHKVKGLTEGETYKLHEEVAIGDYVKASDIEFKVSTDKENEKHIMIDKLVEIVKTDFVTGEEVEGAELQVIDEESNIIDEWTSTKEAHKVKGLEEGKTYKLIEKTAPYGYELTEEIEFKVTTDKETQEVEMKDMPILKDIRLTKIDSKTKEIIKDKFVFGLYKDAECNELITQVESDKDNGTATFDDLRYGTYYIKELSAPKGYVLSDKVVKVEINDKGVFVDDTEIKENESIYNFEFENTAIETPNTGDTSTIRLVAGIMLLSVLGLILLAIKLFKNSKENKNNKKN